MESCFPSQILVSEPSSRDYCHTVHKPHKKSLHVKVSMQGVNLMALMDTGATSSFVHSSIVRKLGLESRVRSCHHDVRFGNGEVETLRGEITLPVKIGGKDLGMNAYVL